MTSYRISSHSTANHCSRWYKRARLGVHYGKLHPSSPSHSDCGLEQAHGFAHSRLDMKRLDVLPVLFEERDEEIDALRYWRLAPLAVNGRSEG
jgi:hypothetical protein